MAQITGIDFSPKFYKMTVQFDPTAEPAVTFPDGNLITVTSHLAVISLELVSTVPDATFATAPLQRIIDSMAAPLPEAFLLQRQTSSQVTVLDINPAFREETFHLRVLIVYNNQIYASGDPTIINAEIPGSVP